MKKLLLSAALLAAFTINTFAYDVETVTVSTNNVQPQAAVVELKVIPCANQSSVPVHIEFALDAAGTDNQTFVFARSVTGATNDLETLAAKRTVVALAATGATRHVTVTNIPTYGAAALIYIYSTNACATAVRTNTIIKYGENIYAP